MKEKKLNIRIKAPSGVNAEFAYQKVSAFPFQYEGIKLFAHPHPAHVDSPASHWRVSEYASGFWISESESFDTAVSDAKEIVRNGPDRVMKQVNRVVGDYGTANGRSAYATVQQEQQEDNQ